MSQLSYSLRLCIIFFIFNHFLYLYNYSLPKTSENTQQVKHISLIIFVVKKKRFYQVGLLTFHRHLEIRLCFFFFLVLLEFF